MITNFQKLRRRCEEFLRKEINEEKLDALSLILDIAIINDKKKMRRKLEDFLRKEADDEILFSVAKLFKIEVKEFKITPQQ